MEINIEKLTDINLVIKACNSTFRGKSKITLDKMYKCEHSPMRTQMFWVEMIDIPTFVSVHFVRHKVWTEHFILSNRDDRGGPGNNNVTRLTPVNHSMWLNAEALINMSKKRLCNQSSIETIEVMELIRDKVGIIDSELKKYMVPQCVYRNGICPELHPCGKLKEKLKKYKI